MQPVFDFAARVWNGLIELLGAAWAGLPDSGQFWSGIIGAIVGAVVGGVISYAVQSRALREKREHRRVDNLQRQQASGYSLLFKVVRAYNGIYSIHLHIEGCYERAAKGGLGGEPWMFVLPLANFPQLVYFSPEEMGMLLGLKDDDVFNRVLGFDEIYNSLVEATKLMSIKREELAEHLKPEYSMGDIVHGTFDTQTDVALKWRTIGVNNLVVQIRAQASRDVGSSLEMMGLLQALFNERLGLTSKLESKLVARPANTQAQNSSC